MKRKHKKYIYTLVILVLGFVATEIFGLKPLPSQGSPVDLATAGDTVSILSTGQANSALISSGGKYCLIDAGSTDSGHTSVVEYLHRARVREIELLVVTHFHTDHTSELIDVLDSFKVNTIVIPALSQQNTPTNSFFRLFLSRVESYGINLETAQKGKEYTVGNGTVTIVDDTCNDLTINDTSVATVFRQGDFSWLNTADGGAEYEQRLVESFNSQVTLFTAGHHGSSSSSTQQLLEVIKPSFVAISAGSENEYGHPHSEVIKRFEDNNIPYSITFQKGTLVYSVTDKKLIENQE